MPLMDADAPPQEASSTGRLERLPFPPVTYDHILHCSYDYWYSRYRSITPKARVIPLTDPFLEYLRADGIVLPPEGSTLATTDDDNLDTFSDQEDEEVLGDPSMAWQEIHSQVKSTIAEFGGKVTPKLNWSAPKDATWMSATNDLQCRSPNDVYLLLKSSDFITHDLEHPFDGCVADSADAVLTQTPSTQSLSQSHDASSPYSPQKPTIPYHLILRKYVNLNPSLEFRCFVRNRVLLCICQRDQNHFDFLFPMRDQLRARIQSFFGEKLRSTFPDGNFVFDVYIPPPHERVWLIDINPWAQRTDPLLFSWLEILTMKDPVGIVEETEDELVEGQFVRLSLNGDVTVLDSNGAHISTDEAAEIVDDEDDEEEDEDVDEDAAPLLPELRLVNRDDPEAYSFNTAQYSAHKLPREVVDASRSGPGGIQEFMGQWQDILAGRFSEDHQGSSSEEE